MSEKDKEIQDKFSNQLLQLQKQLSIKERALNKLQNVEQAKQQLEHKLDILTEENRKWKMEYNDLKTSIDSYKNKNIALNKLLKELQEEMHILQLQVTADDSSNKSKAKQAQSELKKALGKRIKKAAATDKDDLKKIKGLGPFVETKLNRFGIFTFEQISQFDEELINTVTDALQFFPGQIIEDDWVGQASDLLKIKLSNPSDFLNKKPKTNQSKKNKKPNDNTDLKIIEGIGPKIEKLLKEAGIANWNILAQTEPSTLRRILDLAGSQFKLHNPNSWPEQALLASHGKWKDLMKLQDKLMGGRK